MFLCVRGIDIKVAVMFLCVRGIDIKERSCFCVLGVSILK